MSTRGVIARPWGDCFEGRYHHWDSYPAGLGAELWSLYHGRYDGDLIGMIVELIDDAPAGWSGIVGGDWDGPDDPGANHYRCAICGRVVWEHYRQYYADAYGPAYDGTAMPAPNSGEILQFGHSPERPVVRYRPTPGNGPEWMIRSTEDDCGAEWAYVLAPGGLMVCERRWAGDGTGADERRWLPLGLYPWNGAEPEWSRFDG